MLTSLSGWDYEYRATYLAADGDAVKAEIAVLDAMVMKSAAPHLAACAAAAMPTHDGVPMHDLGILTTLTVEGIAEATMNLGLGALAAKTEVELASDQAREPVWCVLTGFGIGSNHFITWYNAAPGALLVERITGPDGTPLVYVQKDPVAGAGAKDPASPFATRGGYDIVRVEPGLIRLMDIYAGDPPLNAAAEILARPHQVLADFNIATKKISINENPFQGAK